MVTQRILHMPCWNVTWHFKLTLVIQQYRRKRIGTRKKKLGKGHMHRWWELARQSEKKGVKQRIVLWPSNLVQFSIAGSMKVVLAFNFYAKCLFLSYHHLQQPAGTDHLQVLCQWCRTTTASTWGNLKAEKKLQMYCQEQTKTSSLNGLFLHHPLTNMLMPPSVLLSILSNTF